VQGLGNLEGEFLLLDGHDVDLHHRARLRADLIRVHLWMIDVTNTNSGWMIDVTNTKL